MFLDLINYIKDQFANNDFFTGIVGGGIMSTILYLCRGVPKGIWTIYNRNFSYKIRVNNIDELFNPAVEYISDRIGDKLKRAKLNSKDKAMLKSPDYGSHFFMEGFNLIHIEISEEKMENSKERKEQISISIFGLSTKKTYLKILGNINNKRDSEIKHIYDYQWCWMKVKQLPKRTLQSIFTDDEVKNCIVKDFENFYKSKERYESIGENYKRGHIYYGEAGTGKSTMPLILANHFNKNLCYLDFSCFDTNNQVKEAFLRIPDDSILVLEDVDAMSAHLLERGENNESEAFAQPQSSKEGLKLSSILRLMDGLYTKDGTVIIATTNHLHKLDKAFVRDGRFDLKCEFKPADKILAQKMAVFHGKDELILKDLDFPVCQAKIQNLLK